MNTKNKIMGIPIVVFVLGLLLIGGASAALVNYLSNTATANVEVKSPMEINFANINGEVTETGTFTINGDWTNTLNIPDSTGLSTSEIGVKVKNNADVAIQGKWLELKVTNIGNDVTCNDISSLMFMDTATPTQIAKGYQELKSLCVSHDGFVVYNIDINSLAPGQEYLYPAKITFGVVAPSNYSFEATIQNTLV